MAFGFSPCSLCALWLKALGIKYLKNLGSRVSAKPAPQKDGGMSYAAAGFLRGGWAGCSFAAGGRMIAIAASTC